MSDACTNTYTPDEMMAISAARQFRDGAVCLVGVGLPSVAACLARGLYAPDITLVYESGTIGAKPCVPPLSIADLELAETADFLVSLPEVFAYWLQGGRIDVGVLGAAQIDRFGNLNSTVIGDYRSPKVRLPGAGGAPTIAANVREVLVILRQSPRAFVSKLDYRTTARCPGKTTVVTDMGILECEEGGRELVLHSRHPGVTVDQIRQATAWDLKIDGSVPETTEPTGVELAALRNLNSTHE